MGKEKLKLAVAQLDINWENKRVNEKKCKTLIRMATKKGVDIIVFPEMTLTGFSMKTSKIGEQEKNSPTIIFFSRQAKKYSISIIFGMVFKKIGKGRNVLIMIDKEGRVLAKYQKIHPFSYGKENKYYQGGKKNVLIEYLDFKIAFIICYDLRFIGLFNSLLQYKPDLVIIIASWPKQRIGQWQSLLVARALDLQAYVAGVNRRGKGGGLEYNGGSLIVSPEGEILLDSKNKDLTIFELDKNKLLNFRKKFPFLLDNKPKLYPKL